MQFYTLVFNFAQGGGAWGFPIHLFQEGGQREITLIKVRGVHFEPLQSDQTGTEGGKWGEPQQKGFIKYKS